jgi:protein arginine kinase
MLNWYLQSGQEGDVVISSRIRLARNLPDIPFVNRFSKEESNEVTKRAKKAIENLGYGLKVLALKDIDDITKLSLMEKHIISPEFAISKKDIGLIGINDDENICIMVNEEDHIRVQVLSGGLDLENSLNLAVELDKKLGEMLNYAYSETYGFLTACPTNCGTGLRASIMVHLPALSLTGNIRKVLEVVDKFGMNIRGLYGEGTKTLGNIYQISNKQTLGISEENTIKNLKVITDKVIEQERLARHILAKNSIELEDRVYRAYGIAASCKKISSEECSKLLSEIRLGVALGIIKELTDLKVNKLETYTKPANLQKYLGETLDGVERDIKRAEIIKQIINE